MGWDKRLWVLCVVVCLFPCACLNLKTPRHEIEFYTLEYDPPQWSGLNPLPAVIRIQRFNVAPPYNTDRMIYREKSFERNAYVYYKWRANPGDLVSYFLGRDLKQSAWFKGALSPHSIAPASYDIEGCVDEFLEWDGADAWQAVLTISVTLMVEDEPDVSQGILFQRSYHAQEPCKRKHPQALAEAMSKAMSTVSRDVITDLYDYLKDRHKESSR